MADSAIALAPPSCLAEDAILALAQGRGDEDLLARAQSHCDACDSCRLVLAEIVRPIPDRTADPVVDRLRAVVTAGDLRAFQDGDILAGRYQVLRWVGRGGMGEVYEVVDTVLRERVALKSLALETFFDGRARERVRAEALLARRVTHPNVCRMFDLVFHELGPADGGTPQPALPLLTMEMLDGRTLSARIRLAARLPLPEALRHARHLAAGLDAAHAAGVVHRDFKSDNVILVRAPGQGPATRAVITDFGLACSVLNAGFGTRSSGTGGGGTLAYMAPERLAGRPATAASDIYSFGVVLYEMVTGSLPVPGSVPGPALRRLAPDLPSRWAAVITRCLASEPGKRFWSAGEAVAALAGSGVRFRRAWMLAVPLAGVLAVAAWPVKDDPSATPAAVAASVPVAVQPSPATIVPPPHPVSAPVAEPAGPSIRAAARSLRLPFEAGSSRREPRLPRPTQRLPQDDLIDPFSSP